MHVILKHKGYLHFALTGGYLAWNERLPNYRGHQFKLLFTKPELSFTGEIETVRNVSWLSGYKGVNCLP